MPQNLLLPAQVSGGVGRQNLADTTLGSSAANITFSSIAGTYKSLDNIGQARPDGAFTGDEIDVQYNGDTGSNYDQNHNGLNGNTGADSAQLLANTSIQIARQGGAALTRSSAFGVFRWLVPDYAGTVAEKSGTGSGGIWDSTTGNTYIWVSGGSWRNTAAITSERFFPNASTNFVTGTRITVEGDQ